MRFLASAIALTVVAMAAPALAQDYNGTPNFGEFRLSPGFTPDPALIYMRAGGDMSASSLNSQCRGWITRQPDIRLYWDGSGSLPLKISALSKADTTLVVNGPRGEWYCDDDGGEDNNPSVQLNPTAGRYEIWVGTYSSGDSEQAVVSISELTSF